MKAKRVFVFPQEQECQIWRERFPHLRLVGRGVPLVPPTTNTSTTSATAATSMPTNSNSTPLSVTQLRPNDRLQPSSGPRRRRNAPRRGRREQPAPSEDVNQVRLNVENQECDRGDVRVPLYVLFNKNYICILRKNSNPGHWV